MGSCANCGGPVLGQLLGHQGRRPDHPRRRLRARLPAAARGAARGHRAAAAADQERGHGRPLARRGHQADGQDVSIASRSSSAVVPLSDTASTETETLALPGDGLREGIVATAARRARRRRSSTAWSSRATTCGCGSAPTRGATPASPCATSSAATTSASCRPSTGCRARSVAARTTPPSRRPSATTPIRQGYAGGETRFQVFARVTNLDGALRRHAQGRRRPTTTSSVDSWIPVYAGANWHERETHEMFGIGFAGHNDLRNIYLPMEFEGHPLRKDFPLLARIVKPWPGIVDVEPLPGGDDERRAEQRPTRRDRPRRSPEAELHRRPGRRRARSTSSSRPRA